MIFIAELKEGINIALHPRVGTSRKMAIKETIGFYYAFSVIPTILLMISTAIFSSPSSRLTLVVSAAAGLWIGEPLGIFICAAILHFFGKTLLRSFKNGYGATFTAVTYMILPALLLDWITPVLIVGIVALVAAWLWSIIVGILALSRQQEVSARKSLGVMLLAILVAVVMAVVVGVATAGLI